MRATLTTVAALAAALAAALPAAAAPAAQIVRVNEVDYRIVLSAKPKAGLVTFVIRITGDDEHDFWLRGGGVTKKTRLLDTGESARISARLKRGVRYQIWCAPHARRGMRTSFIAR